MLTYEEKQRRVQEILRRRERNEYILMAVSAVIGSAISIWWNQPDPYAVPMPYIPFAAHLYVW